MPPNWLTDEQESEANPHDNTRGPRGRGISDCVLLGDSASLRNPIRKINE
jgi:hypothetical protein